jgi:outer membrane protein TolC
MSSGGFGGGSGSNFDNFGGRLDVDVLALWELENLGFGNMAAQDERLSQNRQASLAYHAVRDRVASEVTQAYHQVHHRRRQIEFAGEQVRFASEALPMNLNGIRGRDLRAIEALQAISALADSRRRYLSSIIEYNQAQFSLLRAIGESPDGSNASP